MDDNIIELKRRFNREYDIITDEYYTLNGLLHGKHISYYDNGSINRIAYWNNDQKHGPIIYYREDGTIYYRVYYQNGIVIKDYYNKLDKIIEGI